MNLSPVLLAALLPLAAQSPQPDRWRLEAPERRIVWEAARDKRLPHTDRIEVSGRRVAAIVSYGADAQGNLTLERTCVWPTLRVAPNDTRASLTVRFQPGRAPQVLNARTPALTAPREGFLEPAVRCGDALLASGKLERVVIQDGVLRLETGLDRGLALVREIYPSREGRGLLEAWTLSNRDAGPVTVGVDPLERLGRLPFAYVDKGLIQPGKPAPAPVTRQGTYLVGVTCGGASPRTLQPGAFLRVGVAWEARAETDPREAFDFGAEREARAGLVRDLQRSLRLECPDPVLETLFDFSKLRACESIIETGHGPMHAPGGQDYYDALWANDSVEYVAPFHPFTGNAYANAASLNALGHFARYLNPEFRPLPSSIISGGTDTWQGAGDRGDQAMVAYGASRFLLALGDRAEAERHWPLVEWCLAYLERRVTAEGVIASDSDELEGRFSSGAVNLNTSMLTYGGLLSAADLARELGKEALAAGYRARAAKLAEAMERVFGAEVRGFHTYRYHDGLEELRSWICIPLTMGIETRGAGTIRALFSPRLWTDDGLLTAEGSTTFWDRSTLYALRGVFNAGAPGEALPKLAALSRRRLLGEHVPYVVEAYPEGQGRHLSAESALYARVVTEGLFGIVPRGFRSFTLRPSLPPSWGRMALRHVRAFGSDFDVEVEGGKEGGTFVKVLQGGRVVVERSLGQGEGVEVRLDAFATAWPAPGPPGP
jgi:hypothetical protein